MEAFPVGGGNFTKSACEILQQKFYDKCSVLGGNLVLLDTFSNQLRIEKASFRIRNDITTMFHNT